ALDVESEAEVMHALNKLIVGRTVITISHRLSTLGNVEEIIVLKDGMVVERGTFKELKRQGGVFARLLEEQNRYSAEKPGEQSVIRSAFVLRPADQDPIPIPATRLTNGVPARQSQPFPETRPVQGIQSAQSPSQRVQAPDAIIQVEMDGQIISEHRLEKPLLTIGRITGNDILVPNQRVSRLHARLRLIQGAWVIEDAESVNGIVYQGNRVERVFLTNGDRIALAKSAALIYKTTSFPGK
ncbi:MAG TPA: FHA domain-containing protein, partial [Ktedonobacteraceae bacterium]|nr:FHA domain-containing protein [Ktedonobacteraceae bacterium]